MIRRPGVWSKCKLAESRCKNSTAINALCHFNKQQRDYEFGKLLLERAVSVIFRISSSAEGTSIVRGRDLHRGADRESKKAPRLYRGAEQEEQLG
jgi:hypothetical protein